MALELGYGSELNTLTVALEHPNLSFFGGVTTGVSIVTSPIQTGTYALKMTAANQTDLVLSPVSSSHKHFSKVKLYILSLPDVECAIMDLTSSNGVYEGVITLGSDGKLRFYYSAVGGGFTQQGSATAALSINTAYEVAVAVDDTGGNASTFIEAKLNGTVFASGTVAIFASSTGIVSGQANLDCYGWNGATPTQGQWVFDDWVITDTAGSNMITYADNAKVFVAIPNAAGDANTFATQTGGTAGAANNFTRVNEVTPDDASTFNGSSTLNQEDCLNMSDPGIGVSDTVLAIQVMGRLRNSTADATAALKFGAKKTASGTLGQGSGITPNSTTWATTTAAQSYIGYNDPDSNPWTETTLATFQADYKLTTAPGTAGRRIDVTKVWINVIYVPAVGGATPATLPMMGIGS